MNPGRAAAGAQKAARTGAEKTLEQMAAETQINIRYLREIEEGETFSLPEIYRKTFIRTYAKALGLDVDEILGQLEETDDADTGSEAPPAAEPADGPPVEPTLASPIFSTPLTDHSQMRTMAIVVIFLLTALVLAVRWLGSGEGDTAAPATAVAPGRTAPEKPGGNLSAFNQDREAPGSETPAGARGDSLVLVATSSESVWVHIVLDNDSAVEYTMPPRYSLTLRAAENFLLAVGNPAGLSISLNGRRLDILGDGNRPKKNILLSRKSLAQ